VGLDDTPEAMPSLASLSRACMRGSPLFISSCRTSLPHPVGRRGTVFAFCYSSINAPRSGAL
jgi:hypothetical protein